MDEWFSPEFARSLSLLAFLSILSLLGPYAARGRRRTFVLSIWVAVIVFGCLCLGAAVIAFVVGQPSHVVRPLALAGFVVTVVFAGLFGTLRRAYQEAELRKTIAQDI